MRLPTPRTCLTPDGIYILKGSILWGKMTFHLLIINALLKPSKDKYKAKAQRVACDGQRPYNIIRASPYASA
jgi:hypothetical protein